MQKVPGLLAMTWNHLEQWQLTVDDSNHARMIQIANSPIKTSLTIRFVTLVYLLSVYTDLSWFVLFWVQQRLYFGRGIDHSARNTRTRRSQSGWRCPKGFVFYPYYIPLYLPPLTSVPSWTKRTGKTIIVGLRKVPNWPDPKQPTNRQVPRDSYNLPAVPRRSPGVLIHPLYSHWTFHCQEQPYRSSFGLILVSATVEIAGPYHWPVPINYLVSSSIEHLQGGLSLD